MELFFYVGTQGYHLGSTHQYKLQELNYMFKLH